MDFLMPFPDQDPPEAAALYLSALDHERVYSAAELRHAISRAYEAVDQPAALLDPYQRSLQGAHTADSAVRAERRAWALHLVRDLAVDEDRPRAAPATRPAGEEPVPAELRAARRRPAQVAAAVLGAQMAGVVLANEAPGLLAVSWAGPLNVGLTLVLAQVVITGVSVLWYVRYARNSLDPMAERHSSPFTRLESHR
ncbi:DUF485 domain-containing protein [Streptomyces sp. NPDC056948]|uniref:DUF485 domain-containing protein n=1 Tax=Streptomyces sp. NPDC056948 TaxID=3345975 RepID=UPI00363B461C